MRETVYVSGSDLAQEAWKTRRMFAILQRFSECNIFISLVADKQGDLVFYQ